LKALNLHAQLINQCLAGKRSAQASLYQQYASGMYNVCVRMVGDRALAEDILQEAFVDVFKNLRSFNGDSTIGAWIKRIVVNNCITHLRKRKMQISEIEEATHVQDEEQEEDDYSGINVQKIKDALRKLPQGYKVIFSLYALEGYDHEEISEILGVSVSTSKSQYHRAKKKIRALISL